MERIVTKKIIELGVLEIIMKILICDDDDLILRNVFTNFCG